MPGWPKVPGHSLCPLVSYRKVAHIVQTSPGHYLPYSRSHQLKLFHLKAKLPGYLPSHELVTLLLKTHSSELPTILYDLPSKY